MPRSRARCFDCQRPAEQVGHISKRGLCADCAEARMIGNLLALRGKDEMAHARWVARWLEGCGNYGRPTTPYPPDA